MNKDISPEERLFNAIQEGKKSPPRPIPVKKSEPTPLPVISVPADEGGFGQKLMGLFGLNPLTSNVGASVSVSTPAGLQNSERGPNIKLISRALSVVLGVLIVWVIYVAVYERPTASQSLQGVEVKKIPAFVQAMPVEEFKPVEFYLDTTQKKDIFRPPAPVAPPPVVEEVKPVETGPNIQDVMKNLSLAGIYEGRDLEAMIEDKELKKTYFVKEGDEFKGLKVKSILKDRVVLQLGTQEADLL